MPLIHPRFKDYAYILLITPAFYIIVNNRVMKANPFVFFLAILVYPPLIVPGTEIIFMFFWKYYPLMVAFVIWGMYLYEIFFHRKSAVPRTAPTEVTPALNLMTLDSNWWSDCLLDKKDVLYQNFCHKKCSDSANFYHISTIQIDCCRPVQRRQCDSCPY